MTIDRAGALKAAREALAAALEAENARLRGVMAQVVYAAYAIAGWRRKTDPAIVAAIEDARRELGLVPTTGCGGDGRPVKTYRATVGASGGAAA